jgi:hypothetical protein
MGVSDVAVTNPFVILAEHVTAGVRRFAAIGPESALARTRQTTAGIAYRGGIAWFSDAVPAAGQRVPFPRASWSTTERRNAGSVTLRQEVPHGQAPLPQLRRCGPEPGRLGKGGAVHADAVAGCAAQATQIRCPERKHLFSQFDGNQRMG